MGSSVENLVFAFAGVRKEDGVDAVAGWLEQATGIKFERRQGDFKGGNYCQASGPGGENLCVQNNYISFSGDWMEDDFRKWPVLIYVKTSRGASWFEEVMSGFELGQWIRVR